MHDISGIFMLLIMHQGRDIAIRSKVRYATQSAFLSPRYDTSVRLMVRDEVMNPSKAHLVKLKPIII